MKSYKKYLFGRSLKSVLPALITARKDKLSVSFVAFFFSQEILFSPTNDFPFFFFQMPVFINRLSVGKLDSLCYFGTCSVFWISSEPVLLAFRARAPVGHFLFNVARALEPFQDIVLND